MEIAGDLIAATSKVTGVRAKAMLQFTRPAVCKAPTRARARAQSTGRFAACKRGSANVRYGVASWRFYGSG